MKTVVHWLLIAAQATLLVLSVVVILRPEFRGTPMLVLNVALFTVCCIPMFRDLPAVMSKTPHEIYVMNRGKPGKSTLLEGLALLAGTVAFTLMLW